ncbi:MAG: malonyl-CoA synthase [Pseudomonadota bacterium]
MYDQNHLLGCLRSASNGRESQRFARRPALPDRTFGDLFDGAERMAAALVDSGVEPGDRVAAQVEKSIQAIELYLGTVMAGAIFLPLNPAYEIDELTYFIGDATPKVVICDPRKRAQIDAVVSTSRLLTLAIDGAGSLRELADRQGGFEPVVRGPDDLAAILYTSGTTGRSKGAMLSHANLASNARVLKEHWQFTDKDNLIHALPIYHTHGLFVATNVALLAGASVEFMPGFEPDLILAAMPRATAMMGVPTFYTRLLQDPRLDRKLTANMRLFISGSAPMLVDTHQQWEARTGHRILERYGMTETGMSTSNPFEGERRIGTVGPPLPGIEARIMQAGRRVQTGETGMLEVRGPNVFAGYWQMPEKTAEELRPDGWFITGDLATEDSQGYVTIVGREKDLIITGGLNVYPKEIELAIDTIPGVYESAVIGVPHADFGEGIVAIVVPSTPGLSPDVVRSALTGQLAKFKLPKQIEVVDALPRNAMGKVQKKALREMYNGVFSDE